MDKENTIAYVYKWVHLPSLMWYVGSRTAKGCHPDDGYICSSKVVKPLIQNNPHEWVRTVMETGSPIQMRELECEILTLFDARNDPRSFNMQNGDGKFTTTGMVRSEDEKSRISAAMRGVPKPPRSAEHCAKISAAKKGKKRRPHSQETKIKLSEAKKGVPKSPEHRAKISAAQRGRSASAETRAKMSASHRKIKRGLSNIIKAIESRIKTVIATNLATGETFEIHGKREMEAMGFNQSRVSACARGVSASHKGHTFRFKEATQNEEVSHHKQE